MRSASPQSTSTRVLWSANGSSRNRRNVAGSSDGFRPGDAPGQREPSPAVRERVQREPLEVTHLVLRLQTAGAVNAAASIQP